MGHLLAARSLNPAVGRSSLAVVFVRLLVARGPGWSPHGLREDCAISCSSVSSGATLWEIYAGIVLHSSLQLFLLELLSCARMPLLLLLMLPYLHLTSVGNSRESSTRLFYERTMSRRAETLQDTV